MTKYGRFSMIEIKMIKVIYRAISFYLAIFLYLKDLLL